MKTLNVSLFIALKLPSGAALAECGLGEDNRIISRESTNMQNTGDTQIFSPAEMHVIKT